MILHSIAPEHQFGYKTSLSAADEIVKLEDRLNKATPETHIALMGIAKSFDKLNKTLLWATLYKKGLPIEMITHPERTQKTLPYHPNSKINTVSRQRTT